MKRAAIYTRVSTDEQAAAGESLGVQLKRCLDHCRQYGYTAAQHYQDVMSGRKANRPAYQQLLADCRAGTVDVVVVQFLDRLGRNLREASRCWETLDDLRITVEAADQPVPGGPEGKLVRFMLGWLAERESERIGDRVRGTVLQKIARGEHWGNVPYGWRKTADNRLELNEPEAATVRYMTDLALAGFGELAIANRLNAEGYRRRAHALDANNLWTRSSVGKILRRDRNAGTTAWGAAGRPANPDGAKAATTTTMPAIIRPDQYAQLRDIVEARRTRPGTRAGNSPFILAGLIRCGACGWTLVGNKSKNPRGLVWQLFYTCRGHRDRLAGGCAQYRYYNAGRLHDAVLSTLIANADAAAAGGCMPPTPENSANEPEAAELRAIVDNAAQDLRRQYDLFSRGIIDEAALAALGRDFAARRAAAEQRLAAIDEEHAAAARRRDRAAQLPRKTAALRDLFDQAPPPQLKVLLQELIERVTVWPGGRLRVDLRL